MSGQPADNMTMLLQAAAGGDASAAAEVLPLVYGELRRLAAARLHRTPPGNTLQPTALVHEAYARLVSGGDPGWNGRGHFFGAAAQAMRDILVEQARRKSRLKHGGGLQREDADDALIEIEMPAEDMIALDEALKRLEADDPQKGQIVNLRFFAGLTAEQTAQAMGLSTRTVERQWQYIRAWLYAQLADAGLKPNL